MKKQNKFFEFLNSKGFYTALFTCLFAVLAIAAFVSIRNIDAVTKLTTYGEKDSLAVEEEAQYAVSQTDTPISELKTKSEDAGTDSAKDAKKQETTDAEKAKDDAEKSGTDKASVTTTTDDGKKEAEKAEKKSITVEELKKEPQTETKTEPKAEASGTTKTEQNTEAKAETKTESKPEQNQNAESAATEAKPKNTEAQSEKTSAVFQEGDKMNWPLDGAIVMEFSMDRAIYDKTLDQYRTNSTVSISADIGTQVKAAADGVVKSISMDPRTGYTVVVDHGGGWQSTYGQLQDAILVAEGQSVSAEQAIGGVGNPTKYGVLLGPHLVFGISRDDVPQNPKVVLADS